MVGGFDTFFRAGEDTEIGIRIRHRGYIFRYKPGALIYHRHSESIRGMLTQRYNYEKTYARLHKKYTMNFNPSRRIIFLLKKLAMKFIITPLKFIVVFSKPSKRRYIIEHFIDLAALSGMIFGVINETLFGKCYPETTVDQKLTFIEEAKMPCGWGL